jgi:hypothetical protein
MPLLLRPSPLPDEWLGSWLVRLAAANHLSLSRLLSLMNMTSTEHPPSHPVNEYLAKVGAVTLTAIDEMTMTPDQVLTTIGSSRTTGSQPFLGVKFLQFCPVCLATDSVPYIRRKWLLSTAVACDLHGGPLLDRCFHCQRHLQVYRKRKFKRSTKLPHLLHQPISGLKQCPVCRGALTTPPVPLLRLPPEQPAPDDVGLSRPEDWTRFVAALDLMITSFSVTDLIDFPQQSPQSPANGFGPDYTIGSLPGKTSNRDAVGHRFGNVLLRRLVLTPVPGGSAMSSLRVFASELLDQIEKSPYGHSVRWKYLNWLAYMLCSSTPATLMLYWPGLVAYVVGLRNGQDDLRSKVEIRYFQLTAEQWAMVNQDLIQTPDFPLHPDDFRRNSAFTAYLKHLLTGRPWRQAAANYAAGRANSWNLKLWIKDWTKNKSMHVALERLYDHLNTHSTNRSLQWVLDTEAVFLSDGMINLLIQERLPSALNILQRLGLSMQARLDQQQKSPEVT